GCQTPSALRRSPWLVSISPGVPSRTIPAESSISITRSTLSHIYSTLCSTMTTVRLSHILSTVSQTCLAESSSSMLDEDSARHVWDTVESIWDNRTVVIVEHRVEYIWDKVDRVILMDDSAGIVRDGTPGDILTNHGDLLRALGVWHPRSWDRAPVFERAKPTEEILLEAKGLDVRRRKD